MTVIDGLKARAGGRRENLEPLLGEIEWIESDIESVADLARVAAEQAVIVDCMAWTAHLLAIEDPDYDLELNVRSHLVLLQAIEPENPARLLYLGSRGQYGRARGERITEETHMLPEDIQGVHKLTAESHYRVTAKLKHLDAISLRFPNCYGERQPTEGRDAGLVGGFLRDLANGATVEVFGTGRSRYLVYAGDLAEILFQLSSAPNEGFTAYNYAGQRVVIEDLVDQLIAAIGKGARTTKEMPAEIAGIDIGDAEFDDSALHALLGGLPATNREEALARTVADCAERSCA